MAVLSQQSGPSKPAGMAPGAGLTTASVQLPLRFMVTGMLALVSGVIWIFVCPKVLSDYHYNAQILAITHLFTLGWVTSIIMGALYQLAPVALETPLYSDRMARYQHGIHVVGAIGMVVTFWMWDMKQVGHFGSLMALGMLMFAYNITQTLRRVPRWNLVAFSIAAALFWQVMTMLAGLYLAASKCWNFSPFAPFAQMHTHAHLGGLGFFTMLIMGVSYKLIPMFLLSEIRNPRRAAWSIGLLNAGLLGILVTMPVGSRWKLLFSYMVVAALTLYGMEMTAVWRARKRRNTDWGIRYFFTALWLMLPLCIMAVVLSQPGLPLTRVVGQTENLYGFLGLIGLVTLCILGMLYKIVPFLVWYASYSKQVGRAKVPAMHELYSASLQAAGYYSFLGGILGTAAAILSSNPGMVRWTWALMLVSLAIFFVNMFKILTHLWRPVVTPLKMERPPVGKVPAEPTRVPRLGLAGSSAVL